MPLRSATTHPLLLWSALLLHSAAVAVVHGCTLSCPEEPIHWNQTVTIPAPDDGSSSSNNSSSNNTMDVTCQDLFNGINTSNIGGTDNDNDNDNSTETANCEQLQASIEELCGCSSTDSNPPSSSPTSEPPDCYTTLTDIVDRERFITAFRPNLLIQRRTYIVCSNTLHDVGPPGNEFFSWLGSTPIVVQKNVHWKCGSTGLAANNCVINGGRSQFVSFGAFFNNDHTNVLVEGFTFQNAEGRTLLTGSAGDLTFRNCIFQNQALGIIALVNYRSSLRRLVQVQESSSQKQQLFHDYTNAQHSDETYHAFFNQHHHHHDDNYRALQTSDNPDIIDSLDVNFEDCVFRRNVVADPTYRALIAVWNCEIGKCTLNMDGCVFQDNQVSTTDTAIGGSISAREGNIILKNSCFVDNQFLRQNVVFVGNVSTLVEASNNFGATNSDLPCPFISQIDITDAIGESAICLQPYDAHLCATDPSFTQSPTTLSGGSDSGDGSNTDAPIQAPVQAPTIDRNESGSISILSTTMTTIMALLISSITLFLIR